MRTIGRGLALALLLLLSPGCEGPRPPHIFLITPDTLRADHLSINGYRRETSPAIDHFARGAWHFKRAITLLPKTSPAFVSMFSGLHPQAHGVEANGLGIPDSVEMLAEVLQRHGYRTAAFVSNPTLHEGKGFSRGFEHYELHPPADGVRLVTESFMDWARRHIWRRPTFVWLHYIDPHGPYDPPPEFADRFGNDSLSRKPGRIPLDYSPGEYGEHKVLGALPHYQRIGDEERVARYIASYDAEIRYVDSAFESVIAFLQERDLFRESSVILTSDHGESLGEHNYYFEHGWFAYEPGLRIPLIVKLPGQTEGHEVDELVSILDFRPTILALAGIDAPTVGRGQNLLGPLASRPVLVQNAARYPRKYLGVRTERYKYLREDSSGHEELYDLDQDPQELENLAGQKSEHLVELRQHLENLLSETRGRSPGELKPYGLDEETREQLRTLGYAD